MKILALLLAASAVTICSAYRIKGPLVKTTYGPVRGFYLEEFGRGVDVFLGIPFAKPPIGELRFKKPLPPDRWTREYKAAFYGPSCPQPDVANLQQFNFSQEEQNEDCLYLNVWTPTKETYPGAPSGPKSVMVFIYGGAFFFGASSWHYYDGAILSALGDVVVVSMNYRLGPFGFLNGRIPDAPGNQGLHDQNLALRWVRDNVKFFGGDPHSVTLFGHSAGSMSVGYHIISPKSRGLFHRAIMQSGSPYWNVGENTESGPNRLIKVALKLECIYESKEFYEDSDKVIRCLRNKTTEEILTGIERMSGKVRVTYLPSYGDEIVPEDMQPSITSGFANDVDLLIGTVEDEGSVFLRYYLSGLINFNDLPKVDKGSVETYTLFLFRLLQQLDLNDIAQEYFTNTTDHYNSFLKAASDAFNDFGFKCPTVYFAEDYAKRNNSVYMYYFTHRPSFSWNQLWQGVGHFDEIPFVFGQTLDDSRYSITQEERVFTLYMMYIWTHFAKTGKVPSIQGNNWPKYTAEDPEFVDLNPYNTHVRNGLSVEKCNFWRPRILNNENKL